MTYSDGLTQAAALAAAQATYSNARLATSSEFDDLFAAAGTTYTGSLTASDGFTVGATAFGIATASSNVSALITTLGATNGADLGFLTSPDGDATNTTTRDLMYLVFVNQRVDIYNDAALAPQSAYGWLLVSEASVPEPSTIALIGLGLAGLIRRRRKTA